MRHEYVQLSREEVVEEMRLGFASTRAEKGGYLYDDFHYGRAWDALMERPPLALQGVIHEAVVRATQREGDILVMDQGCYHGKSLAFVTEEILRKKKDVGRVIGYGVTAQADEAYFGRQLSMRGSDQEEDELEALMGEFRGDRFFHEKETPVYPRNPILIAIEHDIHDVMREVQMKFDLIFSHNTYMHLRYPLRAMVHAVNGLKVGGVAIVGKPAFTNSITYSDSVAWEWLVPKLRHMNPGYDLISKEDPIVIRRNTPDPFRTNLSHVGDNRGGNFSHEMVYFKDPRVRSQHVPVDESLSVPIEPYRPKQLWAMI